jgi:hypothetical protein
MTTQESQDPELEETIRYCGEALGRQYHAAWQQWCWLQLNLQEFQELFCSSPERLKILGQTAGTLFWIVQDAMLQGILLSLCRLTDLPLKGKNLNLSVLSLAELCPTSPNPEGRPPSLIERGGSESIKGLAQAAVDIASFARPMRDKVISHSDLPLAIGTQPLDLPLINLDRMMAAALAIHAVLNEISITCVRGRRSNEHCRGLGRRAVPIVADRS